MTKDCNLLGKFNLDGIPPMPRGQPQIDVTFDVDANGVLNVSAVEKSTGRDQKIEIKNDKGRLSDDEIQNMVAEAERYAAEDEANKLRVEAKNSLENYLYQVKSSMADSALTDKMKPEDKETVDSNVATIFAWLEANKTAEKEEFQHKQSELEAIVNPILQNLSGGGAGGGAGVPSGMPAGASPGGGFQEASTTGDEGPKVEEID